MHQSRKRLRIMEYLRPPAAMMVSIHRKLNADITARVLVDFLNEAYGLEEDESKLWAMYYALCQKEREKLSAFIHRIQLVLWLLLTRKLVQASEVDEAQRKQFLRGSSPTHLREST